MPKEEYICLEDSPGQVGGQLAKWSMNPLHNEYRLYWRNNGVKYSSASFEEARHFVVEKVAEVCGMHIIIRDDKPGNFESNFKRIDGAYGVLAQQWLPSPDCPTTSQRLSEFDSGENPTQRALEWTALHEIGGHGLGLSHHTGSPSLMNPMLSKQLHPHLQDWEIEELQRRYGPPRPRNQPTEPIETGDDEMIRVPASDLLAMQKEISDLQRRFAKFLGGIS